MTQMNLSAKEKQTHRHRKQSCGLLTNGRTVDEERIGSLVLADAN